MRLIGARFCFFGFVGRLLGIDRPWHSASGVVGQLSEKMVSLCKCNRLMREIAMPVLQVR
jgi:hypothetical protein